MSTVEAGTRKWANVQLGVGLSTRRFDRTYTRDVGLAEAVTGALVFSTGSANVTLAGQFGAFNYNDDVLVEGTASNNGFYKVTSTGANSIGLNPAPTNETAPATATIRSA